MSDHLRVAFAIGVRPDRATVAGLTARGITDRAPRSRPRGRRTSCGAVRRQGLTGVCWLLRRREGARCSRDATAIAQ